MSIAVLFLKTYHQFFLNDSSEKWMKNESQDNLKVLMTKYYNAMCSRRLKEHERANAIDKSNQDYSISKGSLSENRQERLDKAVKTFEKLNSAAATFSEILGLELPELPALSSNDQSSKAVLSIVDSTVRSHVRLF